MLPTQKFYCSTLIVATVLHSSTLFATSKNASVTVLATVTAACESGGATGSGINFGTLNFGTVYNLNTPVTVTGQANAGAILVKCTAGLPYQVLLGPGQSNNVNNRYLQVGGSGTQVFYNLYTNASMTTIWDNQTGVSQTASGGNDWLPVYGRVSAQSTPIVGNYTDTIQVTVNW